MTVKELIVELQRMPPDAEVRFPNMEIDQLEPIHEVRVKPHYGRSCVVLR